MEGLRGAAGGSGISGLAQMMASQGSLDTQKAAASIGKQESDIKMRTATAGMDIQRMQAQREELVARGGFEAATLRAQGAQSAEQMSAQREQAIASGKFQAAQSRGQGALAQQQMQFQGATDARNLEFQKSQGLMSFYAGQQQAAEENKQADKSWLERTFGTSDRKLKHNIVFVKKSPNGLNIYNFEYKDSKFGEGIYQGVMSDEIPQEAVVKHSDGYDMVNYNKIDVDFIKIKN